MCRGVRGWWLDLGVVGPTDRGSQQVEEGEVGGRKSARAGRRRRGGAVSRVFRTISSCWASGGPWAGSRACKASGWAGESMGGKEGREKKGETPRCISASMWAKDSMGGEEGREEEGETTRCVSALKVESESGAALDTEL